LPFGYVVAAQRLRRKWRRGRKSGLGTGPSRDTNEHVSTRSGRLRRKPTAVPPRLAGSLERGAGREDSDSLPTLGSLLSAGSRRGNFLRRRSSVPSAAGTLLFGNLNHFQPTADSRSPKAIPLPAALSLRADQDPARSSSPDSCPLEIAVAFGPACHLREKPRGFAKATAVDVGTFEGSRRVGGGDNAVTEIRAARSEFWHFP
jgi:hypothetical protein